jgi:sugar/nucleoside kinase (ribokinase family)
MDAMVSLGVPLRSSNDVRSALSTACSRDDLEGAKWFHRAGFSLTAPDKNGLTPIEVAAKYGHPRIIDWIVRKVPLQTGKLQSALALATLQGKAVVMNRLQHIIQVLSA